MGGAVRRGFRFALLCCLLLGSNGWFGVLAAAQATVPLLRQASAIAYDRAGNLYIADALSQRVLEATLGGALTVVAGNGVQGFAGDGGPAVAAQLNGPQGVAVAADGTIYIADTGNNRVRAVDLRGQITTVAGTGLPGFSGEGTDATLAALRGPTALAIDGAGALLVCDTGNARVRRVEQGVIRTVAGNGVQGFTGDGGPALTAALDAPEGVAVDGRGNVYLSDTHNNRVRLVRSSGVIDTFAGTGKRGFAGDGGAAVQAQLSGPRGLALDAEGNLLIADAGNQRVRQVTSSGAITSLAGAGLEGSSADGLQALAAALRAPRAVAVSSFGMPVTADTLNGAVRVLTGSTGVFLPAALTAGSRRSLVQLPPLAPMTYGQAQLHAGVTGTVGTAQGTVQVKEAGTILGAGQLSGAQTDISLPILSAGSHALTVAYAGDGLNPAVQASAAVQVNPAPVSALVNAMTVPYGTAPPAFSGSLLGVLAADSQDVTALIQTSAGDLPQVGNYPVTVSLTGARASNYVLNQAVTTGMLSVVKATSVAGAAVPTQAYAGVPLSLRATVGSTTRGQPTGTVQFMDHGNLVATGVLQGGSATATYPAVPAGTRQITVAYAGDGNFLPSTSLPVAIPVLAVPDFGVTLMGAAEVKIAAGGTAKYTLNVVSNPAPFTGAVSLSASGLPGGANVSFSPPQVVPGTQTAVVTVAIETVATTSTAATDAWPGHSPQLCLGLAGFLFFPCLPRRRRSTLFWVLAAFLVGPSLLGCGARTVSEGNNGLLAKTYAVQISGTSTNLAGAIVTHTVPVSLTVQP